jgi:hypothetical protein
VSSATDSARHVAAKGGTNSGTDPIADGFTLGRADAIVLQLFKGCLLSVYQAFNCLDSPPLGKVGPIQKLTASCLKIVGKDLVVSKQLSTPSRREVDYCRENRD